MGICTVKCIVSEEKLYFDITSYCEVSVDNSAKGGTSIWHRYKSDVHRNSVWIRNQLVVIQTPQWTHYLLTGSDSLPAATAQYQHMAKHYSVVSS